MRMTLETKLQWLRAVLEQRANDGATMATTDTLRRLIRGLGGPRLTREQLNSVGRGFGEEGEILRPADPDSPRIYYMGSQWTVVRS